MTLCSRLRRKIVHPLYYARAGSPRRSYWKILEENQYLPEERLRQIQWQRLQRLWKFVWSANPYYQHRFTQAGLTVKSLRCPEDIQKIPMLTKSEVRRYTSSMLSDGFDRGRLLHSKTGGSTGKALDLYFSERCSELRNACALRHDRWTGWEPGEPIAAVWGNPHLPLSFREKALDRLLQPLIYLDTMCVNEAAILRFVRQWKRRRPTLLFGHAHSLYILACGLAKLGIRDLRPRGILSTSMMLVPHERQKIEKVFQCRVIDRYGCEEVSLIGCECERHEGLHMNIEHLVIEFITDAGHSARPGEPGHIVVTDLINQAMPLIRYRVGDMGVPLKKNCSCGRGLPLMGPVQGRVADFLIRKDGTRVAGVSLIENTLTRIKGIDQMQIVQDAVAHITLHVVPDRLYSDATEADLINYFYKIFPGTTISINLVHTILPESSGKYRFSICRV